jgi:hypothetical protein
VETQNPDLNYEITQLDDKVISNRSAHNWCLSVFVGSLMVLIGKLEFNIFKSEAWKEWLAVTCIILIIYTAWTIRGKKPWHRIIDNVKRQTSNIKLEIYRITNHE